MSKFFGWLRGKKKKPKAEKPSEETLRRIEEKKSVGRKYFGLPAKRGIIKRFIEDFEKQKVDAALEEIEGLRGKMKSRFKKISQRHQNPGNNV